MLKALRMDGLVNADRKVVELLDRVLADGTTSDVIPVGKKKDGSYTGYSKVASSEQFNVIRTYTRKKVREIGEGIFSGNVKFRRFSGMEQRHAHIANIRESADSIRKFRDMNTVN